jgi:uncharacterized protein
MRFSLIPREVKFYSMFEEFAATVTQSAEKFHDMAKYFDKLEMRDCELKGCEDACDAHVEKIIQALDRTFITPFDREDIHTLATRIDDIVDYMEKTAFRIFVFRFERPTPETVELARIILDCCVRLETAIKLLRDMRNSEKIHDLVRDVGRLENDADRVYRTAITKLYAPASDAHGQENPIPDVYSLLKWREVYEWLEATVDACKHVANVISEIVIKAS